MKSMDSRLEERTEPLWTVEEVANYLRVKEETVRMMARTKRLPAMKVGKAWRFRGNEIKNMLSANKDKPMDSIKSIQNNGISRHAD